MKKFSGQKSSGMEIPDFAIEGINCCLLPMIQAYYESAEGQAELVEWSEKKTLKTSKITTAASLLKGHRKALRSIEHLRALIYIDKETAVVIEQTLSTAAVVIYMGIDMIMAALCCNINPFLLIPFDSFHSSERKERY